MSSGGLNGIGEKGTKSKSVSLDLGNWRLVDLLPGKGRMMEDPSVGWRMRDRVHSFGYLELQCV